MISMTELNNKEKKTYQGLFVIGMSMIAIGAGVTAAIDGPFGLFGLLFTLAGLVFLLLCLKNRGKWAKESEKYDLD